MTDFIVGIDISKKDLSVALLHKGLHKKYKISNDPQGFKKLTDWLNLQGVKCVKVCMEATGRYGEKVADYLYQEGHQVHVINPACIKAFARSKLC